MAYLVISIDGKSPARLALDGAAIVGRSTECEVWLDDHKVSRQHCRFEETPDGWTVIDLNSTNGTVVAGQRVSAHRLDDGDEVLVGRARIRFHSRAMPPQRPAHPSSTPTAGQQPAAAPLSDTLVDSNFPRPQLKSDQTPTSSRKKSRTRSAPLPFRRPPAIPQVDDGLRGGWIRSVLRRFRRA